MASISSRWWLCGGLMADWDDDCDCVWYREQIALGLDFGVALMYPGKRGLLVAMGHAKIAAGKWIDRVLGTRYDRAARGVTADVLVVPEMVLTSDRNEKQEISDAVSSLDAMLQSLADEAGLADLLVAISGSEGEDVL
jgi:hypothetical protein